MTIRPIDEIIRDASSYCINANGEASGDLERFLREAFAAGQGQALAQSGFDPIPHLAELIDGMQDIAKTGGDINTISRVLLGPYASLRGGLLLDEPGRKQIGTETAIREALGAPVRISFVTWDPRTDGVVILHDGKLAWQESTFDSLSQYLRNNPLVGTGQVVTLDVIEPEQYAPEEFLCGSSKATTRSTASTTRSASTPGATAPRSTA